MDLFALLAAALLLLIGLITGAAGVALPARRRISALEAEVDDVGARLGESRTALAAAEAERGLLAAQNERLSAQGERDTTVLRALAPVAEKLSAMQNQVTLLERDRVEQYGQLAEQLREARASDQHLMRTTHSLASALRSSSARGRWGEVQLRRVVEAAGMLSHVDFAEQVHHTGAEGATRPDMVVTLPGAKQIVVDAKVPLAAYLRARELPENDAGDSEAAGGSSREDLLAQHAKAVKAHVDTLAAKKYWDGCSNSPELVICFLPAESFLSSALAADPALLEYAFGKNVALASPVTLLATLKAVAFAWRQEVLTDNAKELFELSRQLYDRLGTMGKHVSQLGSSLKSSVERYNSFVGTLETRVYPTARKLSAFDPAAFADQATGPASVEATPRLLSAPELLEQTGGDGDREERRT